MPQSQRTYCVVWTIIKEKFPEKNTESLYEDHSKFFEDTEEEKAKTFYRDLLNNEDTFCASFCKVLEDSEG